LEFIFFQMGNASKKEEGWNDFNENNVEVPKDKEPLDKIADDLNKRWQEVNEEFTEKKLNFKAAQKEAREIEKESRSVLASYARFFGAKPGSNTECEVRKEHLGNQEFEMVNTSAYQLKCQKDRADKRTVVTFWVIGILIVLLFGKWFFSRRPIKR